MMLNRNGLLGVLSLCVMACGDGGGGADDAEPTATSALVAQPDVALVEGAEDHTIDWDDWDDWSDWNDRGNGWNSRGSRPSTAPGGNTWDASSVSRWCSLLDDRQAEFLCKVTLADCEKPRDVFTQILCQLRGLADGGNPSAPSGGSNKPPSNGGDAWGNDLVDVDGDNGGDGDDSNDEDEDQDENDPRAPGLGG